MTRILKSLASFLNAHTTVIVNIACNTISAVPQVQEIFGVQKQVANDKSYKANHFSSSPSTTQRSQAPQCSQYLGATASGGVESASAATHQHHDPRYHHDCYNPQHCHHLQHCHCHHHQEIQDTEIKMDQPLPPSF